MVSAPDVFNIITAIVCIFLACIIFFLSIIKYIAKVIVDLFFLISVILIAVVPFWNNGMFGILNNPIGRPLYLFIMCGSLMADLDKFDGICNNGGDTCAYQVSMAIGFFYAVLLLIVNIIFMALKQEDVAKS
ncbi:Transmembrane domain-containing protein [Spironucleus salmonicida]|uniref:Transmembrane domain-containing protein n=1 Tax=Spironucleus salmonicida TaxID=348837 RepID=A0A9P8LZJ2_9EUKA|nr:Transmembrane domain-containing protein [Spironucleus salmonicida]